MSSESSREVTALQRRVELACIVRPFIPKPHIHGKVPHMFYRRNALPMPKPIAAQVDTYPRLFQNMAAPAAADHHSHIQMMQTITPLTAAEESELICRVIDNNCAESRELLMRANFHMVEAIANRYSGRGVTRSDLIEGGVKGLIDAVETFDPTHGARFSTYASWGIKQAMKQAMSLTKPLEPAAIRT